MHKEGVLTPETRSPIRWLVLLGCLGLFLRLAFVFAGTAGATLRTGQDDDGDHVNFARHLTQTGEYATVMDGETYHSWRPPLFVLFLTGIFHLHGLDNFIVVRLYIVALSMLIPFCCWKLGSTFWGPEVGLLACGWAAVHPSFIYYASVVQADSLFISVATVAMTSLILQRTPLRAAITGALIAIACFGRSEFAGAAPVGFFWCLLSPRMKKKLPAAAALFAGFLVIASPWWVRNYQLFHKFIPFSTEGGYTIWVGNNPLADGGGDCPISPAPKGLSEIDRDQWHYRAAVTYMRENPGRTAELGVSKLVRFWGIVPRVGSSAIKAVSFLAYAPMFALAILWIVKAKGSRWIMAPVLALCVYYSLVHSIFPSVMRYRLALEPFIILMASAGLLGLMGRLRTEPLSARIENGL